MALACGRRKPGGYPGVVGVGACPDDVQAAGIGYVSGEQVVNLSDCEHLIGVLAGQQHELPPAVTVGQADADVWAGRVAVQRGIRRIERVVVAFHHYPLAGMGVAAESDAE